MIPTHADPSTWPQCITADCYELVDPWDHNTRCPEHRPDPDAPLRIRRHVTTPS